MPLDALPEAVAGELQRNFGFDACCILREQEGEWRLVRAERQKELAVGEPLKTLLTSVARAAWAAQAPQVGRSSENRSYAVGVPLHVEGGDAAALLGLALRPDVRSLPLLAEAVEAGAEVLAWVRQMDDAGAWREIAGQSAAVVELLTRLNQQGTADAARQRLVDELASFFQADAVVLALPSSPRGGLEIAAASLDSALGDEQAEAARAACEESLLRGGLSVWPPPTQQSRHALVAHRQAATELEAPVVATLPLWSEREQPHGAILVAGECCTGDSTQRVLAALAEPLGASLALWRRAQGNRVSRTWDSIRNWCGGRKGRLAIAATLLAAAILCIPRPYLAKCDCEVRPAVRRFVAAPFDAALQRALVEPGDVVAAGQTLGELDGREIRWELAGVSADLNRAATERSGHMATHDPGAARVAEFEMQRLEQKAQLLDNRSRTLEIRSPIDGIIIAGDHKKSEGVPVKMGQTLFEVAPLERMLVELQIAQDDIAHVAVDQPVEFTLEAYPGRTWSGVVSRIHPQSEERDGRFVFIAEFAVPNDKALLRPGMQGRASIRTASHPLGWNLFHRPWDRCLLWLGW
jgi:biotin carboxyl carrier protein